MKDARFAPCPINHYRENGVCVTCDLEGRRLRGLKAAARHLGLLIESADESPLFIASSDPLCRHHRMPGL